MSAFTQWLDATESDAASEPSIAFAVNNLRQSLSNKLVENDSKPDAWLTQALKQSKSVFTCSGILQLQPVNATINPSINHSTNQSISESSNQSNDPSNNQSNDQTINQTITQTNKHVPGAIRMLFELPKINNQSDDVSAFQLSLPLSSSINQHQIDQMMSRIISLCQPATFGVGGKTVLDPSYRSCDQLAPDSFFTSFTPIDTMPNIIHEIHRVLCPSINQSINKSLRAELYKLNIYSKGGTFKSHRDTPRSSSMIGSLVVCLPIPHQGGTLIVRHPSNDQTISYDWQLMPGDEQKLNEVHWCAFYGDCEHEILPVTSGHRVTLTYNLYFGETDDMSTSSLALQHPLDDRYAPNLTSPFPSLLRLLLRSPSFMPAGGRLGICCHHGYAHTSNAVVDKLNPRMLKGGDAMVYESVRALGLRCDFVPLVQGSVLLPKFQKVPHWGSTYPDKYDWGSEFYDDIKDEDGEYEVVKKWMGYEPSRDVIWLTKNEGICEVQEVFATYGNEPAAELCYSQAALIVQIDRYDDKINGRNPVPLANVEPQLVIKQHPHPLTKSKFLKSFRCFLCSSQISLQHRWLCAQCRYPYYEICLTCQQSQTINQ